MTAYTISIRDAAMAGGLVWKIEGTGTPSFGTGWESFVVESEAQMDVIIFSDDFPAGVSVYCLLENLKRVRAMETGLNSLMKRIAEEDGA